VLEGSVQRDGDQVRITAQLIDARSGYHLWSEKYDRRLTNVFAIEDEIARAIATKLRAQWNDSKPLVRNGTRDMAAHALYLQAIAAIARRGVALKDAAALLEQATARDPEYAAAWAQLSQVQELMPWYELAPWDSALAEADRTAHVALALDDASAEAHAALASVLRDRFAFADAERSYRRSLELNPGLAEVHNQYAQLLDALGRLDAAMAQERIAIEIDPLAANPQYMLGLMLDSTRRHDEATASFRAVMRISPDYRYSRDQLVFSRIYAGDFAQARAAAALPVAPSPGRTEEDRDLIQTLIAAVAEPARRAQALARVGEVHHLGYVEMDGFARAFWYGLLGDPEHAISELQQWRKTAPQGQLFNALRFLWMPAFDPLRGDPRFEAMLAELGLPELSVDALRNGGARAPAQ
jgi:serine/threonine-protein kinase